MKMRNMIATMTAVAVSAVSFAAMTASAAEKEIAYTGPTAGALTTNDDGSTLRMNIYNIWGNSFKDIDPNTVVMDYITVTFTISGLGTNSANTNQDGTPGEAYFAELGGQVGTNQCWKEGDADWAPVAITGDGQYTVTWNLAEDSATIDCLLITTNINVYNYGEGIDASGLNVTIDSIKTGAEDAPVETTAPAETTTAPAATTTAAGTTAAAGTTTAATTAATTSTTTNANTGDNGIAIALAALTGAGALALVSKKRD